MKSISKFIILLSLLFICFLVTPVYALVLGPGTEVTQQELYENLFKENKNKPAQVNFNYKSFKLSLKESGFKSVNPEIDTKKFNEAVNFLENRLKQEELKLKVTYEHLSGKEKALATSFRNTSMMGLAMFAVLWSLPTDFTGWKRERNIEGMYNNWRENISKGPVFDKDLWALNYIGHPLSGAYEYSFLRSAGFSKLESFGFAVFFSTVMWEYGIEGLEEVPSWQDIFITPIIGSLIGEAFLKWDKKLAKKDYILLNSKRFGMIVHHLINPVEGINNTIDKITSLKFLQLNKAHIFFKEDRPINEGFDEEIDRSKSFGIRFVFSF